jgi:hypothetical protein
MLVAEDATGGILVLLLCCDVAVILVLLTGGLLFPAIGTMGMGFDVPEV